MHFENQKTMNTHQTQRAADATPSDTIGIDSPLQLSLKKKAAQHNGKKDWATFFLGGVVEWAGPVNNPEDAADPSDDDDDESQAKTADDNQPKSDVGEKLSSRRPDRPYRDGFTSLRSIWRAVKRFRLTNVYIPAEEIVTCTEEIDYSSSLFLGFKDPQLQSEYRRFLIRDISTFIVGFPFLSGNLLYPAFQINRVYETYPFAFIGAACMMAVIAST